MPRLTAVFRISPPPGMIDQDMPHHLGRDGEEVGAILPLDFLLSRQTQIRFVDQRGGRERVTVSFSLHIAMRYAAQLIVDQRRKPIEGGLVALLPIRQQLR